MKPYPLFFERAHGSHMWDVDDHDLVDYVLGWGAIILGHCHPAVTRAVQEQAARGELFGAQHRLEFEVAEKILSHLGSAERLLFSNTGSEAVQAALRLARAYKGRHKVLKFVGHYHGWSDSVLISYRPPPEMVEPRLESQGQNAGALSNILVARWNDRQAVADLFRLHSNEIAAVIAEPVLCNSGVIAPDPGFLEFLRAITHEHDGLLIFDEVITGYRVGLAGASGRFAVAPDLVTLGKAVANGYPLSVVAGRAAIVDQVSTGGVVHAGTFNGNPIVLAAAEASLSVLEGEGVYPILDERAAALARGLTRLFADYGVPTVVHQIGGMVQVLPGAEGPVRDYAGFALADWDFYDRLSVELLQRGVFVMPGGRLYLSLAHTPNDIEVTLGAFDAGLSAITSDRGAATTA